MVKSIEVLTVVEKNDEATLKRELIAVQTKAGQTQKQNSNFGTIPHLALSLKTVAG